MREALKSFVLEGIKHTIPFCLVVLEDPKFIFGDYKYSLMNYISR
jgi:acetyl/propionyl-CoA carboxylase alpha subunit